MASVTSYDADVAEYRIDELAQTAGTTVRNVRAYQERGLIDAPRRLGRVAIYEDTHLARLRLILKLLDRGATLQLIADLVEAWHGGHNIADLLGLEAALLTPTSDEPDAVMTSADLGALFGADPDPADIRRALDLGILRADGEQYRVLQPRLVQIGTDIAQMGVPVAEMLDHVAGLRDRIDVIAHDFVDLAMRHVFRDMVADVEHADLSDAVALIQRLRPLAKAVVDIELTTALDTQISDQIALILSRQR